MGNSPNGNNEPMGKGEAGTRVPKNPVVRGRQPALDIGPHPLLLFSSSSSSTEKTLRRPLNYFSRLQDPYCPSRTRCAGKILNEIGVDIIDVEHLYLTSHPRRHAQNLP